MRLRTLYNALRGTSPSWWRWVPTRRRTNRVSLKMMSWCQKSKFSGLKVKVRVILALWTILIKFNTFIMTLFSLLHLKILIKAKVAWIMVNNSRHRRMRMGTFRSINTRSQMISKNLLILISNVISYKTIIWTLILICKFLIIFNSKTTILLLEIRNSTLGI